MSWLILEDLNSLSKSSIMFTTFKNKKIKDSKLFNCGWNLINSRFFQNVLICLLNYPNSKPAFYSIIPRSLWNGLQVSALTDFIEWLEKNRGDAADKVILVYHEFLKISPGMLLEALRRHHLIDRFCSVVKGFLNGFTVSEEKCSNTTKSFSLRVMSKLLLDKEDDLENAQNRAQAAYEIVMHLAQGERPDLDSKGSGDSTGEPKHIIEFVRPFTNTVAIEQDETAGFKVQ